jgi:hypothetical protein
MCVMGEGRRRICVFMWTVNTSTKAKGPLGAPLHTNQID